MTKMPRLWSTGDLYPPDASPEQGALLGYVLTGDLNEERRPILRRTLVPAERSALEARKNVLQRYLTRSRHGEVVDLILELLSSGFATKTSDVQEAGMIATQYAYALRELPAWSIKRACDRFASGSVQPEEIGEKRIDRAYAPSSAQIAVLARRISRPVGEEFSKIEGALRGLPGREHIAPTQEEKDRIAASMVQHQKDRAEAGLLNAQERLELSVRTAARMRAANLDSIRAQYVAEGLEAPKGDAPTSLSLRLAMGWTIQDVDDKRVLVAPPKRARVNVSRETRPGEMGS